MCWFSKVAKILDIANLNIQIKIRTELLSQGIMYGAYLVFKFCNRRKFSSQPLYVNLRYKKAGETLNAYFAEWRAGDKWFTVELFRFFNYKQTKNFEVLLESFSRYYCGNGGIFVEGIEFRAIQSVESEENKEIKDVQRLLKSESDMELREQSANDYHEAITIPKRNYLNTSIEELDALPSELPSLSKVNGKKCHMLPAKAVINASSNVKCCNRKPPAESRCQFAEVVELLSHFKFRIKCNIKIQMLSLDTTYACFLVFKISEKCHGLKCPVKARDLLPNRSKGTIIISFRSPSIVNLQNITWIPVQREAGWMEVIVWEIKSGDGHNGEHLPMDLKLISFEGSMSGLIICGIEFRPI